MNDLKNESAEPKAPVKRVFAFDRINFILLAVGMAIVIIGMVLMSGSGSNETTFNPEIFSAQRIKVARRMPFRLSVYHLWHYA